MKLLPDLSLPVTADINDPQPLILYHGRNCPDGYGAALAAWLFFSGNAEFRGLDHGEIQTVDDLGPLAGRTIYILDFAFGPELLAAIEAQAHKLVLLDHHKSAAEKLHGYQCTCGVVHFDMNKSGARLGVLLSPEPHPRAGAAHRGPRHLALAVPRKRCLSGRAGHGAAQL